MAKTMTPQINPLSLALRELMNATMCPGELLSFLTKMVYFMHAIRLGKEGADESRITNVAGENTDCIYAALLLIENVVPAWYALRSNEPDEDMVEEFEQVVKLGGIELWRKMLDQFRLALSIDLNQGTPPLRSANLIQYYTAFCMITNHCEAFLNGERKTLKAA